MSKNTPEIRFNGFEDSWEQCKLEDISIVTTGYPFDSKDFSDDGQYLVITNGNIQDESAIVNNNIGNHITVIDKKILSTYLLDIGDILVTMDGTVGRTAKVFENGQILAQRVGRVKALANEEFLYQWLNTGAFSKEMLELSHGGTIKHISLDEIRSFESAVPKTTKEQMIVGEYFRNIDYIITLHQQEYDKLVNNKKAMLEKMFPKEGCDVPEIRFKGFEKPWERCTFKECFGLLTNNTLSRAELNDEYGTICNIHYGDILIKFKETINAENDKLPFITTDINVAKTALLQNGDIIIADTAEDSTVGKCTEITGILNKNVVSGLHTIPCRPCKEFSKGYLGFFMNSPAYHNQLFPLMQGTKVTSVSKAALQNTMIYYPSDINEQKLIGDFFININSLIVRHQQELEKLKNIKAALLEKMFV